MVNYICGKCGYSTTHKSNFNKHVTRKTPCAPVSPRHHVDCIENVSLTTKSEHKVNTSEHKSEHNSEHKVNTKVTKVTKVTTQPTYNCKHCNKKFKTSTSRYRHQRKYCKFNRTEQKDTLVSNLLKKNKMNGKEIKRMTKLINRLLNQIKDNNCSGNNNNNNNIISNNKINKNTQINNTQTNNQTFKINNYGEEDLSYITLENKKKLLIDPRNSITNLIDDTHFNSEHPENANMRIPNKKQPFIELYVDNAWKMFNQYKTVCSLLKDKKEYIHTIFIKTQHELTTKEKEKYLNYKKNIDRDLFLVKQVLTDIRASIISGTRNNPKIKKYQNNLIQNDFTKDPIMELLEQLPGEFLYEDTSSDSDIDIDNECDSSININKSI